MKVNITIGIPAWVDKIFAWPVMVYRKLKYGYTFRKIYLGEGVWTILDQQDYCRLGHFKWHIQGNGKKLYAVRDVKVGPGKTKLLSLHREIMGQPKRFLVDHKNVNPLDNRKANLRRATRSQNCQNVKKRKNTSSRFIGVSFHKRFRKWCAYLHCRRKKISLGYFDNEIEAAKARDKAAKKYHGEFACLNFPPEKQPKHKTSGILSYLKIPFASFCGNINSLRSLRSPR